VVARRERKSTKPTTQQEQPPPNLINSPVLKRAKTHRKRYGRWPNCHSGAVTGAAGETWSRINTALSKGRRGLPGGENLHGLLRKRAGKPRHRYKSVLSRNHIIAWAREHRSRTGLWPTAESGRVRGAPGETWRAIDSALHRGHRGLHGGSSLAHFLDQVAGRTPRRTKPRLTIAQIVRWADEHRKRTGDWPTRESGPVRGAPGETWMAVQSALIGGWRGLARGNSLPKLLNRYRGRPITQCRRLKLPRRLSVPGILEWADAHHRRHGRWPSQRSGPIDGVPGLSWSAIDTMLRSGAHGLPGGGSLAGLLRKERGESALSRGIAVSVDQILRWADAHHRRTGCWPSSATTRLNKDVLLTWQTISRRLAAGRVAGVPTGTRLTDLLRHRRSARYRHRPMRVIAVSQVLAWADDHHHRTGNWPTKRSGPVVGGPNRLTWWRVNLALAEGSLGLPETGSIAKLLVKHRRVRSTVALPPLSENQILRWADAFHKRTARWPTISSGGIPESPSETWATVNSALRRGVRGLPGGDSLFRLLTRRRGARRRGGKDALTVRQILTWAEAHHRRTGRWPSISTAGALGRPPEHGRRGGNESPQ